MIKIFSAVNTKTTITYLITIIFLTTIRYWTNLVTGKHMLGIFSLYFSFSHKVARRNVTPELSNVYLYEVATPA